MMNPSRLPWKNSAWLGRRVVVTGSGRGIGQGCARFFAKHQAKVLLVVRSQSELEATQRELLQFTMEAHSPSTARQPITMGIDSHCIRSIYVP